MPEPCARKQSSSTARKGSPDHRAEHHTESKGWKKLVSCVKNWQIGVRGPRPASHYLRPLLSPKDGIEELLSTGVQAVVGSGQQGMRTMMGCVKRNGIRIEVPDIVQMVRRALKKA